jgi:hypothetical protein
VITFPLVNHSRSCCTCTVRIIPKTSNAKDDLFLLCNVFCANATICDLVFTNTNRYDAFDVLFFVRGRRSNPSISLSLALEMSYQQH